LNSSTTKRTPSDVASQRLFETIDAGHRQRAELGFAEIDVGGLHHLGVLTGESNLLTQLVNDAVTTSEHPEAQRRSDPIMVDYLSFIGETVRESLQ
jgi:hypothetical protein